MRRALRDLGSRRISAPLVTIVPWRCRKQHFSTRESYDARGRVELIGVRTDIYRLTHIARGALLSSSSPSRAVRSGPRIQPPGGSGTRATPAKHRCSCSTPVGLDRLVDGTPRLLGVARPVTTSRLFPRDAAVLELPSRRRLHRGGSYSKRRRLSRRPPFSAIRGSRAHFQNMSYNTAFTLRPRDGSRPQRSSGACDPCSPARNSRDRAGPHQRWQPR